MLERIEGADNVRSRNLGVGPLLLVLLAKLRFPNVAHECASSWESRLVAEREDATRPENPITDDNRIHEVHRRLGSQEDKLIYAQFSAPHQLQQHQKVSLEGICEQIICATKETYEEMKENALNELRPSNKNFLPRGPPPCKTQNISPLFVGHVVDKSVD
jgi:hypothetical protein